MPNEKRDSLVTCLRELSWNNCFIDNFRRIGIYHINSVLAVTIA